jgi:hypothetical protein
MKRIKLFFIIAAFTGFPVLFSSCEDVLDKKPLDLISETDVWSDASLAQANLYGLYHNLNFFSHFCGDPITYLASSDGFYGWSWYHNSYNSECQSDIFWGHWLSGKGKDDTGWTTSTDFGWDAFSLIRRTNIAIAHLTDEANRNSIGASIADDMLGQAYLLKSAFYFMQARKYGGYVIVDEVLDDIGTVAGGDETAAQKLKLPRATMQETYDYAIELCEKAANLLNTDAQSGQLNKGSAYALLSEMALHAAAYLSYYDGINVDGYYQKVIQAVQDLDALNKYSLVSGAEEYMNMFSDYSFAQTCPENILVAQMNESYGSRDYNYSNINRLLVNYAPSLYNNNINLSFQPLSNGYTVTNGGAQIQPDPQTVDKVYYIIDLDGKARRFEESQLFAENIEIVNEADKNGVMREKRKLKSTSSYTSISDLMYSNRDQRFAGTFAYDGSKFLGNTIYFRTGGNLHRDGFVGKARENGSMTGILYSKKVPQYRLIDYYLNCTNPIFRLGRCYLNAAEAYLSLSTPNEAKAKEYINKTRVQHGGLPELTTETGGELKMIYLDERAAELNLENDRYLTLLRTALSWGVTDPATGYPTGEKGGVIPELNRGDNPTKKLEIEVPGNHMVEEDFMKPNAYYYCEIPVPQADHNFIFTPKKRYLLPVPQSELMNNENLWQNDDWK